MECTDSSSQEETRGVVDSSPIEDGEALLNAATLGRVSDVRYLIKEKGCDPMSRDENGRTVLHKAASLGQLKVVQCLIDELGVDPKSCRDDKGQTPLHEAAQWGQLSILRYLIKEKGCDPMSIDEDGWTVLHWAACRGRLKVVQCLIDECGMDPKSCRDDTGQTPLHTAAQWEQLSILRYLIKEKGCDPMSRNEDGLTVLHKAATISNLQVIQCLIDECGMDPKSCIDPMLIRIILHRNLRIREYFKSKIPTLEVVEQEVSATSNNQPFANSSNQLPPSTEREKKLVSGDLHQISSYLHNIPYEALLHLGVALGLNYIKLKHLDKGTFLLDMLAMWLREEDDVIKSSGPPTWRSLVKALRAVTVAQKGIADTIEKRHL